jgi:hypothetical protein
VRACRSVLYISDTEGVQYILVLRTIKAEETCPRVPTGSHHVTPSMSQRSLYLAKWKPQSCDVDLLLLKTYVNADNEEEHEIIADVSERLVSFVSCTLTPLELAMMLTSRGKMLA